MKKNRLKIETKWWLVLSSAVLILLLFLSIKSFMLNLEKEDIQSIDISQFEGRLLPAYKVKPGTFTIHVEIEEALKFGKNAILTYQNNGIEIWKPDPLTNNTFLYSSMYIKSSGSIRYKYRVFFSDKEGLVFKGKPLKGFHVFSIFLSFVLLGITVWSIFFCIKSFKN